MGLFKSFIKTFTNGIGQVIGGDYKGSVIVCGSKNSDSFMSVSIGGKKDMSNDAIIILSEPEFKFDKSDVEKYSIYGTTPTTTTYAIDFKDGKRSLIEVQNQYKHRIDTVLF